MDKEHKRKWTYDFSSCLQNAINKSRKKEFGICKSGMWKYCNCEALPSIWNIRLIADDLGCSVNDIIPQPDGVVPFNNPIIFKQCYIDSEVNSYIRDAKKFSGADVIVVKAFKDEPTSTILVLDDGSYIRYDFGVHQWYPVSNYIIAKNIWSKIACNRLYRRMRFMNLKQHNVGELTGISTSTLSTYVSGKAVPSVYSISLIARTLRCAPSFLIPLRTGLFEPLPVE